jgi:exopolysaccharide production protein ExoZ
MYKNTTQTQSAATFQGIQLLRFFSALMVVLTHATFFVSTRIDSTVKVWNDGAQGVAIFFVISGFVMALTSRNLVGQVGGWHQFMCFRLIRIVPLYWALNALKIAMLVVFPVHIFAKPDVWNIIFSLLFIPSKNSIGEVEAFYGVGWTLNFEMFFYVIFALALFLRVRVLWFVSAVLLPVAALSVLRQEHWPAVTYLLNILVLNFLWGMLIAELVIKKFHIRNIFAWILIGFSLMIIFLLPDLKWSLGLQYAALVAGVVFLEPVIGKKIPKVLIDGGNASYALYLVHPLVGVLVSIILAKLGFSSVWCAMLLIVLVCLLVSSLVYTYFERPVSVYLKQRFSNK